MRILSVVTLVTPDGAYGGPVRVAVNQAAALTERGHRVTLVAAHRGFDVPPTELDDVPVRLFESRRVVPGIGFAGLASPAMLSWLRTTASGFDVAHLHLARDLITLPAARVVHRAGLPFFVQPHGMIDPSTNPLTVPLDAIWTRPLLRSASGVFHLTELEREHLRTVAGDLRFIPLTNGVPDAEPGRPLSAPAEVLFLARMAPRKRPVAFVEAAAILGSRFPGTRFTLVGPDEGTGDAVRAAIAEADAAGVQVTWEGGLAPVATLDRMRQATIYVLPAVDEPYGMTVVEALSVGRPVVVTQKCGLAGFVADHDAGTVADTTVTGLADAIGTLLGDLDEADAKGARGRAAVRAELSMAAIAGQLAEAYSAVGAS